MIIKKIKEGYIDVPIIEKKNSIKRGLYLLIYQDQVIKVGVFGEGVNSNSKSRFSAYRSKGKDITPGNGSYKTMKVLNEKLKVGEHIDVAFKSLPEDIELNGYKWKVDLYHEEDKLKNKFKNTLWLS